MRVWIVIGLVLSLLGCHRGKKEPRSPTAPAWMQTQVEAQAKQVAPGATAVTPLFRKVAYRRNDNTRWPLELQAGHCYLFSTVGDESVERIYVLLWDTKGDRQFAQKQPGPGVVAEYCPEVSGTHEFEVKIAAGHGHYLTRVFARAGGAKAASARPVVGAQPTATPPVAPPPLESAAATGAPADPIATRISEMARAVAGANEVGEMREGTAEVTDWYVALEPTQCYWFFAVGDEGVEKLSLFLWDPSNERVADSKSGTAEVELGHCPKKGGMFHVQAKVAAGSGRYGMSVYAKAQ